VVIEEHDRLGDGERQAAEGAAAAVDHRGQALDAAYRAIDPADLAEKHANEAMES